MSIKRPISLLTMYLEGWRGRVLYWFGVHSVSWSVCCVRILTWWRDSQYCRTWQRRPAVRSQDPFVLQAQFLISLELLGLKSEGAILEISVRFCSDLSLLCPLTTLPCLSMYFAYIADCTRFDDFFITKTPQTPAVWAGEPI